MRRVSTFATLFTLFLVVLAGATALSSQPITVNSFPYQPSESELASDFLPNHGTGPTTGGSSWTNGTLSGARRGSNGAGDQAWAVLPTTNYADNTTTWLHSPIFDLSGASGLELKFELWIRTKANDAMKLQVSTNGGTVWSDVSAVSVAYNVTASLLSTKFGGSNSGWGNTNLGGATALTCGVNLNPWAGQSDVRFRWCFVSNGSGDQNGPVIDSIRVLPVLGTIGYSGGYIAVPQGQAVNAVVTKTGGSDFTTGMAISFGGNGLTGTVGSVIDPDNCNVTFLADRSADVGSQAFYVESGGTRVCEGIVDVHFPQQLISNRQGGSAQEPPMNGTMVANGVYAHNGEFVHSLPILSIPGRMLPLSVGLTYRSRFNSIGPVGAGWSASFDTRLTYSSGADQITLYSGGGRIDAFSLQGGGTAGVGPYILPGFFLQIWRNNNGTTGTEADDAYTVKYAHGSTATFVAVNLDIGSQQVFRQTEFSARYGNKVTYQYNSAGQLECMLGDMYDGGVSTTRYALTFSYGMDGRLNLITDYADYTGQQSVIGSSYTGPREWEFVYNGDAQLTEIRLPKTERYYSGTQGANYRTTVKFTYDSNDNLLEVIDARQTNQTTPIGWLKNHYDGSDRVGYQDVGRNSTADTSHRQFIYYTSNTETDVLNAEAHRSTYYRNSNGTLSGVRHHTTRWTYAAGWSSDGVKAHSTDPNYFETLYQYDTEFHVIRVDYPRGNRCEYRYDITNTDQRSRGNLLRVLSHPGSTSTADLPTDQVNGLLAKFTYTSAAQFNLLATSVGPRAFELKSSYKIATDKPADYQRDDSSEFTSTNTYNTDPFDLVPDGVLESCRTPAVSAAVSPNSLNPGQYLETRFAYTSLGQLMTATDQAGVVTRYEYGTGGFGQGYLLAVKVGDQTGNPLTSTFSYNSVGRAIGFTDPKGHTYTSYVNQLDQVVRGETPMVSSQMLGGSPAVYYSVTEYDLNGNVEVAKVANIDEHGNVQSPTTIDTTYTYNLLDMVTLVTEPIDLNTNRSVSFSYDLLFRSTETVLPEGNRTGTDYDELNRAIKSHAGYDGVNVLKANALITSEMFYDLNSNVVKSVDGRGNDSHFYYDSYDRVFKAEDRLASTPNYSIYTYNQAGQVLGIVRYGKKNVVTYPGGVEAYTLTAGQELGRAESRYDNMGRGYFSRTRARDEDNIDLGYSNYESSGPGATDGWSTSTVKFRANGQVEEAYGDLQYPTKYTYDVYNRLQRITDDRDGVGSDDNYDEYSYDANGNVVGVRARLFDDVGSAGNKLVTTSFAFDELNRLVSETSPEFLPGQSYTRYFKYDSRSNLVRTVDRKSVERITTYDLLSRPARHKVDGVLAREVDPITGAISTIIRDIVSRTIYDKNSNAAQSIDSNGNRTYFRYDLADRWLQTQHADGGVGTPLKSTAGSGHTITQVGSGVFYSKSGAYDANSNLLAVTDENGTVVSFTYDENDLPLSETGAVASGNPFNIEGETGLSYAYDGLYRAAYGETHDASNTLTETDSVFNSLGGLERQRQRVHQAHPSQLGYSHAGTVFNNFDESGRRYQRINPGTGLDMTRTTWAFDRKHRPTETWLEYATSGGLGWTLPAKISEYAYLGGGLLHSRQTRYVKETTGSKAGVFFPIVSDFEHDDLLRVTSVRHWRNDASVPGLGQYRLLGRYDYSYDENSMMLWEARWHEDDQMGASTTPDEVDFYSYSGDNQLQKAAYNVTQFGFGQAVDLNLLPTAYNSHFDDDTDNTLTCSDRVYYGRRKSSTRDRVNWYRGSANRTDLPSGQNDRSTGPTQKTHYDTSDDPNAHPDNAAADGNGSRHNYTVIGQIGHTYDKNRNVLADGTREFRYNYKNQMRHVWRKSDGDTVNTGTLAKYREDAFGRRVYAESYWELSRRVYLDTRFELDVNVDADNDGAAMVYVDGGITSNLAPPPGQLDQKSSWDSRIRRNPALLNEAWYFDFLVDVPAVGPGFGLGTYIGFVSYDIWELRIYGNGYELWNTQTSTSLGTHIARTAGRRNIGIRAGVNGGVWVNGAQLTLPGLILTNNTPVIVGFGTHDIDPSPDNIANGLVLLENLNYIRSYNRAEPGTIPGVVVNITNFDGLRPVTVWEPIWKDPTMLVPPICNSTEDGTRTDRIDENGEMVPHLYLPNGRRITGVVVAPSMCSVTYNDGVRTELDDPLPGVYMLFTTDAVGAHSPYLRIDPLAPMQTPWDGANNGSVAAAPIHELNCIIIEQGTATPVPGSSAPGDGGGGGAGANPGPITGHRGRDVVSKGNAHSNSDPGTCSCRDGNPSNNKQAAGRTNTNTGNRHDHNEGDEHNAHDDVEVCKGPQWDGNAMMGSDGNWYVEIGGKLYRIKNIGLTREEDDRIIDIGKWVCAAGMYSNLEALDTEAKESSWWDGVQYGLGVLQGIVGEMSGMITSMLDALGAFIDDPAGFIQDMMSGLGQLVDALGQGDMMTVLEGVLPGVASFVRTHLMEGSARVSLQDKGKALGAMIVEVAGMFAGAGAAGGVGAKLITAIAKQMKATGKISGTLMDAAEACMKGGCFVAGTLVWVLKDGITLEQALAMLASGVPLWQIADLVAIELIRPGDYVLARDERSEFAPLTFSPVRSTNARKSSSLVDLSFESTSGTRGSITTTDEHPFWVSQTSGRKITLADTDESGWTHTQIYATRGGQVIHADHGWAFAADLEAGDRLATPHNTHSVSVTACAPLSRQVAMVYNLDVGGTNTYFVAPPNAPDQCIWVHNAKPCPGNDGKPKRVKSETLRNRWEKEHGKPWPKDPDDPSRNQDVSHKKPLADGGTNDIDNIEPKPHEEHMREHRENGDCSRWGRRAHGGTE